MAEAACKHGHASSLVNEEARGIIYIGPYQQKKSIAIASIKAERERERDWKMSDSVFMEDDGSGVKRNRVDAISPLSMESSVGGLEVFVEEDEEGGGEEDSKQQSSVSNGEQNGKMTGVNGFRSVSVSPKLNNSVVTSDESG